jgi:hypothetical protein
MPAFALRLRRGSLRLLRERMLVSGYMACLRVSHAWKHETERVSLPDHP